MKHMCVNIDCSFNRRGIWREGFQHNSGGLSKERQLSPMFGLMLNNKVMIFSLNISTVECLY